MCKKETLGTILDLLHTDHKNNTPASGHRICFFPECFFINTFSTSK